VKLTKKELEIMALLWRNKSPMTATEIIESSNDRTWRESSIYVIMNTLVKKGAIILKCHKPTGSNTARAYAPMISSEEFAVGYIGSVLDSGIDIDINILVERLKSRKG
jgi:BlaI family penicillinase repressor